MNWFYAKNGQQTGPVEETELARLVADGSITGSTLVWRDGMAQWQPYEQVWTPGMPDWRTAAAALPPASPAQQAPTGQPSPMAGAATGPSCSVCGRPFPPEELVSVEGRMSCAGCKPILLQRLKEGATSGVVHNGLEDLSPDSLVEASAERGGSVEVSQCLNRAWEAFKREPMLLIGSIILIYLCIGASGMFPIIGICIQFVVNGPLMAGMWIVALKVLRGEDATVGDAFSGFSRAWWPLVGAHLAVSILTMLPLIPAGAAMLFLSLTHRGRPPSGAELILPISLGVLAVPAVLYLTLAWFFSLPLIVDRGYGVWDAMNTSRRVVNRHLLTIIVMMLLCLALTFAGALALCLGLLVSVPLCIVVCSAVYEEILGTSVRRRI